MSLNRYVFLFVVTTFLGLTACSQEPDTSTVNENTTSTHSTEPSTEPISEHSPPLNPAKATIETVQLQSLTEGGKFVFKDTDQNPIVITIDESHMNGDGSTSLSGTHRGEDGLYQLTATAGETTTFGRIKTPETTYTFTIRSGQTTLVDLNAPGNALVPKNPDDAIVPQRSIEKNRSSAEDSESSTPTMEGSIPSVNGKTTIDLMIVYSAGFAAEHPGDALTTRLNYLVAFANTLYNNSNVDIYLRLVHTVQSPYADDTSNEVALTDLQEGNGVFSTIETVRQLQGADLVSFIRPYDKDNHSGCGVAYVLGAQASNFQYDAPLGYSVVSDGSETFDVYTYFCSEQTLAHELGHNMGSVHDRAHSTNNGAYSYSYGYGIDGNFGTVMSYISPEIDYFSNPDITCDEQSPAIACGISEESPNSANNALSLNNAAASIAAFVAGKYSADVDGDGDTDSTDALKALMLLSGSSVTGTVSPLQDINRDSKLGLAEAIYSLQKKEN